MYYFKCRKKPKPSKSIGGNGEEMAFTGVQNNSEQMAHNEVPTQPDSWMAAWKVSYFVGKSSTSPTSVSLGWAHFSI